MPYPYDYATGYRTAQAAEAALDDAFATGDVVAGERPQIHAYKVTAPNGGWRYRYRITLHG